MAQPGVSAVKRKKIFLILIMLILPGWLLAFISGYLYLGQRAENIQLRKSSRSLEESLNSLNKSISEALSAEEERAIIEQKALSFVEWQFVLKDQAETAENTLKEQIGRVSEIKKNKPLLAVLYYNLAMSQMLASDFESAIRSFNKSVSYNQKGNMAYYNLGILCSVFRRDPRRAVDYYSSYLKFNPKGTKAGVVKERIEELKRSYEK